MFHVKQSRASPRVRRPAAACTGCDELRGEGPCQWGWRGKSRSAAAVASSRRRADDADASTSPEDGDEDAPDAPVSDAPEELPVAAPASVEPSGPMSGTFNPRVEPTAPVSEEAPSEEEARTESLGESSSLPGGRPAASSPAQGVAEPSSGQDREPDASAPPSPTPPEPLRARAPETAPRCLLYTSPSPRDGLLSRMPSSA